MNLNSTTPAAPGGAVNVTWQKDDLGNTSGYVAGGSGSVTSVALTVPARQSVSGSPIVTAGTLAITDNSQSANQVFAGPTSGASASPAFRALVTADLPSSAALVSSVQQQGYTYAADAGSANAYAVTLSPAPTLVAGSYVVFKAANANTGASTLNVNSGGAVAIKKQGSAALSGGEILSGQMIVVVYDGTNFQLIGSAGGSSPAAPSIRGTGIQASSASSYTVSWPSGTAAGDLAIIFVGHAFAVSAIPAGWTALDNSNSGSNWLGAAFCRVLNSADIVAGSVTVGFGGSFDGVLAVITFVGATGGIRTTVVQRNGSGSSSITLATDGSPLTTDVMVYFGSNRAASTDTVSLGTMQRQANDGSAGSGCLYAGSPAATGGVSPVFSYSSAGTGNYQVAVAVKGS